MPVQSVPAPPLVVVQAALPLGLLVKLLDGPTRMRQLDQAWQRGVSGQRADVVFALARGARWAGQRSLAQQPALRSGAHPAIGDGQLRSAGGPDGQPHVVPVGFRYNPELDTIDIGGHDFAKRKKYRDVQLNPQVAFVVDDVLPPWKPRMIEIRGTAEVLGSGGEQVISGFDSEMFRIRPRRIVSMGIEDGENFGLNARSIP
jgi:pyridoxamine 5'-phosphate oxidase family protein